MRPYLGGLAGSAILGQIFEQFDWAACVLVIGITLALAAGRGEHIPAPPCPKDATGPLGRIVAAAPERPTLIAMHHPPVAVGMPDFDAIGLTGREAFGEIVARHPQILGIACGHVHRDIVAAWRGALVAVTPGTGYQYALRLPPECGFVRVPEPPAVRHFLWREDAGLVSHIGYVAG